MYMQAHCELSGHLFMSLNAYARVARAYALYKSVVHTDKDMRSA